MSAYKIQTLGIYPEESIKHSEHGKSLKSKIDNNYQFLKGRCWGEQSIQKVKKNGNNSIMKLMSISASFMFQFNPSNNATEYKSGAEM